MKKFSVIMIISLKFSLTYTLSTKSPVPSEPERIEINDKHRYICSPNYPAIYNENANIIWIFPPPGDNEMVIFDVIDINLSELDATLQLPGFDPMGCLVKPFSVVFQYNEICSYWNGQQNSCFYYSRDKFNVEFRSQTRESDSCYQQTYSPSFGFNMTYQYYPIVPETDKETNHPCPTTTRVPETIMHKATTRDGTENYTSQPRTATTGSFSSATDGTTTYYTVSQTTETLLDECDSHIYVATGVCCLLILIIILLVSMICKLRRATFSKNKNTAITAKGNQDSKQQEKGTIENVYYKP